MQMHELLLERNASLDYRFEETGNESSETGRMQISKMMNFELNIANSR